MTPAKASEEQYESVQVSLGQKIEWDEPKVFLGTFRGAGAIEDSETGESSPYLAFTDENGKECFAWRTYQLGIFTDKIAPGDEVRIEFLGKRSMPGTSNQIAEFRCGVKRKS